MSDEKKNGRIPLVPALTILGMLGGFAGTWWALAGEQGRQKEKVETIERRQIEDRVEIKTDVKDVKQDVKDVKQDVNLILRKLNEMEAAQKAARRER